MDPNRRHNLYRPQIPADPLRRNPCDTRDPRICVQPLKGLGEPRAASGSYRASVPAGHGDCGVSPSYRASSPTGESLPLRITATHPTVLRPTANYSLLTANWTFTFSAKERDSETGLSYFGSRYYSSDLSVWLSVDPQSDKYASLSPYVYCADNPVRLVDPNGEENMYAFHYAQRYLLNKVGSVHDISTQSWYGYGPGQHSCLTQQDPDNESCYGIIWHAYMNSGDKITSYLQTGFSNKNNYFKGRYSAKEWFLRGNDTPANEDGLSRSFETDIMKGEIGDIVFMKGHAAMLAGLPEQIEEDGNTYVKLKVFTSTSNSGFIEQDIIFDSDKNNRTTGWSGFEGYGQLHQTQGKGNPVLE